MSDDEVLSFKIILKSVESDHKKDSNSERTKSIKNDLTKRVDKL